MAGKSVCYLAGDFMVHGISLVGRNGTGSLRVVTQLVFNQI